MQKTHKISFSYTEYEKIEELAAGDRELVLSAREAALKAYAPYSEFRVGAAIRLESGNVIKGANVENAAFPSGICAERSALAYSVSNFPGDRPVTIAIAAFSGDGFTEDHVSPCGNCRQVIAEEEMRNGKEIRLILSGTAKTIIVDSIRHLLPLQFNTL